MNKVTNQSREVGKNTVALALSRSIDGCSSILLSFVVARQLGAGGLGIYSAALVFYGLIALASEMGSTNFLIREIARDRTRTSRYLVHLGTIIVVLALFIIAGAAFVIPYLGYSKDLTLCV